MKANNDSAITGHNRTIKLTEIPGDLNEMYITINYTFSLSDGDRVMSKAIALDSVVIPTIVRLINEHSGDKP